MYKLLAVLMVLLVMVGCSSSLYQQGKRLAAEDNYQRAVEIFYQDIKDNPKNARSFRELGITFYKMGELDRAEEALKQANNIEPDARASLYLGLTYEKKKEYDQATKAYRSALALNPGGDIKDILNEHLDHLVFVNLKREVNLAIEKEGEIKTADIPDNTIAVVDFNSEQLPPDLTPISKGLAELTAADLAKVHSLRVVDRLKIDEIQKELKISSSSLSDPEYAPRLGRLLGSRKIVTGTVVGIGDDAIRLNGAIVNTPDTSTTLTAPTQDNLRKFFKVQKDFVFDIIDSLDIKLTPEERDAIEKVPTESYLAFLAYSRGLDLRSQGNFDQAEMEFQKAVSADHNFGQAQMQMDAAAMAPKAGSEQASNFNQFETEVTSNSDRKEYSSNLSDFQAGSLGNTGFIDNTRLTNDFNSTAFNTLRFNTGADIITIYIRGRLDADL